MAKLRCIWRIAVENFSEWPTSPRVYVSFILGALLSFIPAINLGRFAQALGEPLNAVEPFIYIGSSLNQFVFIFLGGFLLLSNAPFVSQKTTLTLIRMTRKTWAMGNMLYMLLSLIVYYLWIMAISAGTVMANSFWGNTWSDPFYVMTTTDPMKMSQQYNVYFESLPLLQGMRPLAAVFHTFVLLVLYGFALSVIMFCLNLYRGRLMGCAIGLSLHGLSYFIIRNTGIDFPLRWSLIVHAMPASHRLAIQDRLLPTFDQSYWLFALVISVEMILAIFVMRRFDYRISVGDKE